MLDTNACWGDRRAQQGVQPPGLRHSAVFHGSAATGGGCSTNKLDGVIDVHNKGCNHPGYEKLASYGAMGNKTAEMCGTEGAGCHSQRQRQELWLQQETVLWSSGHLKLRVLRNTKARRYGQRSRQEMGETRLQLSSWSSGWKGGRVVDVISKRSGQRGCKKSVSYEVDAGKRMGETCRELKRSGTVNVTRVRGQFSSTPASPISDDDDDGGEDGAVAVAVKRDVQMDGRAC